MLVLSRKVGQEILIPELGVVIQVTSTGSSKVQLGVQAPRDVRILRGELADCDRQVAELPCRKQRASTVSEYLRSCPSGESTKSEGVENNDVARRVRETSIGYRIDRFENQEWTSGLTAAPARVSA
ncbi:MULTISPECIES: carbon storage regulator [Crateriforma]|uniref:Translational regulator CsrA n=1 Tax=Crateriforma conspicua TaxID=2527996 RepID=A0A5C6FJF5_9PLAN|nr:MULTISPECIES: carbon storage regulator [Crateriforma]TWU60950.1 carbon storage regulator [Crateriforma conspicua]